MSIKLTQEQFIEKCKQKYGDFYNYEKTIYTGTRGKIIVTCPIHGDFEVLASNFTGKRSKGCPKCGYNQMSSEQFIQKSKEIHGDEFDYSQCNFVKFAEKVTIKCNKCGQSFQVLPQHHLQGRKCPHCCSRHKVSLEEFIARCKNIHNNYYDYSQIKILNTMSDKVPIICPKHGIFYQEASIHAAGSRCPKCYTSKGELQIERFLQSNNIPYIQQKRLTLDRIARTTNEVVVDFYIEGKIPIIIEFNGKQHYVYSKFHYHTYKEFELQQQRDQALRDYCKCNNIRLVEICYKDQDKICDILESNLNGSIN